MIVNAGFTTFEGTVTAASNWGAPAERKRVRPGLEGSYEELFHHVDIPAFQLALRPNAEEPAKAGIPNRLKGALPAELLERAIGVIYLPETERWSHYFSARLAEQFDTIIHFDSARAVEPLERTAEWQKGELPETYPSAM